MEKSVAEKKNTESEFQFLWMKRSDRYIHKKIYNCIKEKEKKKYSELFTKTMSFFTIKQIFF